MSAEKSVKSQAMKKWVCCTIGFQYKKIIATQFKFNDMYLIHYHHWGIEGDGLYLISGNIESYVKMILENVDEYEVFEVGGI